MYPRMSLDVITGHTRHLHYGGPGCALRTQSHNLPVNFASVPSSAPIQRFPLFPLVFTAHRTVILRRQNIKSMHTRHQSIYRRCTNACAVALYAFGSTALHAQAAPSAAPALPAQTLSRCNGDPGIKAITEYPETLNVKLENDLVAGTDRNYTNGIKLTWVSGNVQDYVDDPCLPQWIRGFNRKLEFIDAGDYASRNMSISLGQSIFTPKNPDLNPPDPKDRPYAGWLYLGLGYNARGDDFMRTYEVNLGVIGPAAIARQSQDLIHDARDIKRFEGWNYQLKNEFGAQLIYERKDKWTSATGPFNISVDAISHYGASLGNVATYANVGGEIRIGYYLPDDFGTSAIRPGGDNAAPLSTRTRNGGASSAGIHLFASVDGRAMARNIFLDGNTFRDSAKVDKKFLVADLSLGVAWIWRTGKLAYAHYFRTKEFNGQEKPQSFGSFTLSLNF